ncbi:MAG: ATP-binding protein [Candidatus Micrarchaeota archaeon]
MPVPTKKEILDFSPLNAGGREDLPAFERSAFGEVKKAMGTGLIVAVTGLRRVGKTTLVKQALGNDAFYFSFDEKKFANHEALKKVVEVFLGQTEKPTIFLDEIFRVEDWAGVLKKYHDQRKASFVVSGSSSLNVRKGVESLAGRLRTLYLPPLQFDEFLGMSGKPFVAARLQDVFNARGRHEEELEGFMKQGSFPEIVGMDEGEAREYIRSSTIERIVFEDIPSAFKIEHPSKLYDLVRLCATNSSRLFTEVNFAEATTLSRHAVSDYLLYLDMAYLASALYPAGSFQKALKKQKKIFVKTASIYNALAESPSAGQAAETCVYDKLCRGKLSFYRDAQQREVDFVSSLPIEVKFQSTITSDDVRHLLYFMDKHKKSRGIVVTKNLFDEKKVSGKTLTYIPLDVFLLVTAGLGTNNDREIQPVRQGPHASVNARINGMTK